MKRTRFYILLAFLFSTNCPILVLAEQLQNEPAQQEQIQKDPIILTKDELKYLQTCDDQQVYLSNEFRKVLHFVENKLEVNKDSAIHALLNSSKSEFKFIPQNLTYYAIKELKSLVDNNKDKFEQEYTPLTQAISFYEDELNNKDAHIKFNKDDNNIECNSLAADCFDNDSVLLEESGAVKAKVVRQNPDATPRIFERPVRIDFDVPNRHALTVIGLTAFHGPVRFRQRATFFGNVRIDGNLIVGGTITSGGETLVNNAQNVGTGEGEVFQSKTDGTLNFRTLEAGSNVTIATNDDTVTISATGGGGSTLAGDVSGPLTSNVVDTVGGKTAAEISTSVDLTQAATSSNTPNTLVLRDGTGSFSSQTVNLAGNLELSANGGISTATEGNITKAGALFVHNFGTGGVTNNTFVGLNSGLSTPAGAKLTALGFNALRNNSTGNNNTAIGFGALQTNTANSDNTAIGNNALNLNNQPAFPTFASQNTAVGSQALQAATTVSGNTAVGYNTLAAATGSDNTAVGRNALSANTSFSNVALGSGALSNKIGGFSNIAIGTNAGSALFSGGNNNILIGSSGADGDTGSIQIGGINQTSCFIAGINGQLSTGGAPVFINGSNKLGTTTSSIRYKKDVQKIDDDSNQVLNLNPVKFKYKNDKSNSKEYGLIAEEVKDVMPELVIHDQEGQPQSVKYHVLPVLLLNELQKMKKDNEQLKNNLDMLTQKVNNQEQTIKKLMKK